ncbi:MAG: Ppx/GppA family phosphatase [Alphaproteobacteria bacterium]|nr:Ppx/GppA family phosphatase [Alphaproteobacteria bacterium]
MMPFRSRHSRVAIIDIGSNSIRMVVYDDLKRAAVPLYNEKLLCQLGKNLATTGRLYEEGVVLAREALARFVALARNMDVGALSVMATAAVRDAEDGREFARAIEREYRIDVDIISGDREAKLGAYGICASVFAPSGITGDLGGGSMELVHLEGAALLNHVTLPIGPLRLLDELKGRRAAMRKAIEGRFQNIPWLKETEARHFYAIGGSFRAIAKLHMQAAGYPLRILHQYEVEARQFAAFAAELAAMPAAKLAKLPGLAGKRVPTITPAAMILEQVLEVTKASCIVFSASGIREGYLFEKLPMHVREQDVLLAICREFAGRLGHAEAYARELLAWMDPLLMQETAQEKRLRAGLCYIVDIALHIHPEYRAEWSMQRVLYSAFTGITHRERAMVALALYHRYQFKLKEEPGVLSLVNQRERAWARLVGTIANLAYHLSGSTPGTLSQITLGTEKDAVTLAFSRGAEALMGEAISKRIVGVEEAWRRWREEAGKP